LLLYGGLYTSFLVLIVAHLYLFIIVS
jgi:hypothetical protein